jgi:hypothetical protein
MINIIIPHFDKYPLITQKRADFILFKSIIEVMKKGEHLTIEGLYKILSIKAYLNKGLPETLLVSLPTITPSPRKLAGGEEMPVIETQENIDPFRMVGFVMGEGCFYVSIQKSKPCKTGFLVVFYNCSTSSRC